MNIISNLKGDKVVWYVVLALSIFSFLPSKKKKWSN